MLRDPGRSEAVPARLAIARGGAAMVSAPPIALSAAAGVLMAVASAAGLYLPDLYANESVSWAAQGVGQDFVNVVVVCPALLVSAYLVARGSRRALLVWLGLLLYVIYSYVLYAFFVHFNRLFLVYVSVLGLSFWAVVAASADLRLVRLTAGFDRHRTFAAVVYLMVSALLFGTLWLVDIVHAMAAGTSPHGVTEVGLPVNPIHVLDLAFALPAMAVTSVSLWKNRPFGLFFAVPLMTFAVAMGAAIVAMSIVMQRRGLIPDASGTVAVSSLAIVTALILISDYVRRIHNEPMPASDTHVASRRNPRRTP
jgi:hypothetical protein